MKRRKIEQTESTNVMGGDACMKERVMRMEVSPYRFFAVAAILAALFSMLPTQADAPDEGMLAAVQEEAIALEREETEMPEGIPAGAELPDVTQAGTFLHRTLQYVCGHSVQRREPLPARLRGLSRDALDTEIARVIPGGQITGFSVQEVDIAQRIEIPCPLHWVLRLSESGTLEVLQNMDGETLCAIREVRVEREMLGEETQQELLAGVIFDDVQALEGYLENLSS